MKNLKISAEQGLKIKKKSVIELVSSLKNEFGFSLKSLEFVFVTESTIHKINKEYLKHNYPTDIITFAYSGTGEPIEAEIYICSEVAEINAGKYKVPVNQEIFRLIIHGILHIMGFDDKTAYKKKKMKRKENELLVKFSPNS
ncbi:MAG: rRNA maturation RNase YbeY [Ignavibacteriaceae bacterium]|nr:rRNA maturation RNase YbeY [Ignavibacteriaceae bacterium]